MFLDFLNLKTKELTDKKLYIMSLSGCSTTKKIVAEKAKSFLEVRSLSESKIWVKF